MSPGTSSAGPLTTDRPPAENSGEKLTRNGTRPVGQALARPDDHEQQGGSLIASLLARATDLRERPLWEEAGELEQAARWCGRLWGRREGRAVVGFGHDGQYGETGSYRFGRDGRGWRQRDYVWPAESERLLEDALEAAPEIDVYVSVLLHQAGTSGRGKATALPGPVAWVDVDGDWTTKRQAALDDLEVDVWHVASGARGGRHVYVPLGEDIEPGRLEQINRRLSVCLDGDSGWERTKVLRLPGTLNHKPRPLGTPSAAVRWLP